MTCALDYGKSVFLHMLLHAAIEGAQVSLLIILTDVHPSYLGAKKKRPLIIAFFIF